MYAAMWRGCYKQVLTGDVIVVITWTINSTTWKGNIKQIQTCLMIELDVKLQLCLVTTFCNFEMFLRWHEKESFQVFCNIKLRPQEHGLQWLHILPLSLRGTSLSTLNFTNLSVEILGKIKIIFTKHFSFVNRAGFFCLNNKPFSRNSSNTFSLSTCI